MKYEKFNSMSRLGRLYWYRPVSWRWGWRKSINETLGYMLDLGPFAIRFGLTSESWSQKAIDADEEIR